jgi:dTDP-4-dehydrorhamnose reductase
MKVVVIGANGQLGIDVAAVFENAGHHVVRLTHADMEIADEPSVSSVLGSLTPTVVVNTAAMHNVDQCEKDPLRAFAVNAVGARNLAQYSDKSGAYLLHVSTDYVFDGAKAAPYLESDPPAPLNVYGNSKLAGEYFVTNTCRAGAVLRVSGVYGANACRAKGGLNFVRLMLKLAAEKPELRVVDDEILTPTYTVDIARQIVKLADARRPGLFHGTAEGACSWYEFACHIFEYSGVVANLQKARLGEFPAKVARPSYSVLENARLKSLSLDTMPPWQDGLRRYLAEISMLKHRNV